MAWRYFSGGAGDERTLRENRLAFERHRLRPRVLVDVGCRSLATTVLGRPTSWPVLVAPMAFHGLACEDAEAATARAAAAEGTVLCVEHHGEPPAGAGAGRGPQRPAVVPALRAARPWRDRRAGAARRRRGVRSAGGDRGRPGPGPAGSRPAPRVQSAGAAHPRKSRPERCRPAGGKPCRPVRAGRAVRRQHRSHRHVAGPRLAPLAQPAADRAQGRAPSGRRPPRGRRGRGRGGGLQPRRPAARRGHRRARRAARGGGRGGRPARGADGRWHPPRHRRAGRARARRAGRAAGTAGALGPGGGRGGGGGPGALTAPGGGRPGARAHRVRVARRR